MMPIVRCSSGPLRSLSVLACLVLCSHFGTVTGAQEPESAMVRMLRSGRVPSDRQGTLITLIGRQGSATDIGFLLELATDPELATEATQRLALDAMTEAARTRRIAPEGDRSRITALISGETAPDNPEARLSAIRLAGAWKVESSSEVLAALASDADQPRIVREAALSALADIGGEQSHRAIESLASADQPIDVRMRAIAALVGLDLDLAAERAVEALAEVGGGADLGAVAPLLSAFLDRQAGPDRLAAEIRENNLATDPAKVALRFLYSVGRTDPALVAALSEAAGIAADPEPMSDAEMQAMITDVLDHGDPARGETIFRREDVNCTKCHALAGAGGDVGPDLSAMGASSPPDYLIRSIIYPEEAVKEEYAVKTVLTIDGQIFQGVIKESGAERLVLREATGVDRVIPVDDIEDEKVGGSLMPVGLVNFLTRDEFVDLVAFLAELGKPGPYAIRSTPTIQRWGVLPLPESNDPDTEESSAVVSGLPLSIASVDPSEWRSAYGKVDGNLPLDEVAAMAESTSFALLGEVEVNRAGALAFSVEDPEGLMIWLNGEPVEVEEVGSFSADLAPGRHALIVRVDAAARSSKGIRIEITRSPGSRAEFTVVGGP